MTMKFALKAGCAALAFAGMASANAGLFYMDIGTNYGPAADQVTPTSTSVKNQLTFQYESSTVFTDLDGSTSITVGDTTNTTAGLALPGASLTANQIQGFTPNQISFPTSDSNNGYGTNWLMSFGISNLTGEVTSFGTGPEITYNSGGVLNLYVWDTTSATNKLNFMNILITGGSSGTGGTILNGKVDFTGIEGNVFRNLFHSDTYTCNGSDGFYDLWNTCGANPPGDLSIVFRGDFNTDPDLASAAPAGVDADGNLLIAFGPVRHDGSATFDIPEPGSLALLGLAMAGLGLTQRRRKISK